MKKITHILTLLLLLVTTGAKAQGVTLAENVAHVLHDGIVRSTHSTLESAIAATTALHTIEIIADFSVEETVAIPADKIITLDLNGHTITATKAVLQNNGTLTIKDSQKTGKIVSTNRQALIMGTNSFTYIYGGRLEGLEGAIITGLNTGATITIHDGTFVATDNAVLAGNGTQRDGQPNTFNIQGGTFLGSIKTPGYIACGIYCPWKDIFNIYRGTFNITGGAGVVARAGQVNISDVSATERPHFTCTGTAEGWVGDNKNVLPSSAVVFDTNADYPALTDNAGVIISAGVFESEADLLTVVKKNTDLNFRIQAMADDKGTPEFNKDIDDNFCAEGFNFVRDANGRYGVAGEYHLTDAAVPYWLPSAIFGVNCSYTRQMPTGTYWGTVCLPFALHPSRCRDRGIHLFLMDRIENNTLILYELTDDNVPEILRGDNPYQEYIKPGIPLIFYYDPASAPTPAASSAPLTEGTVVFYSDKTALDPTVVPDGTGILRGTLTTKKLTTDIANNYYINGDHFRQAKAALTVPAYRAYIYYNVSSTESNAKPTALSFTWDGATAAPTLSATNDTLTDINSLQQCYTPDGTRLARPQKGLNIIALPNGKTIKAVIR